MRLPLPPLDLLRALQVADFANASSMHALEVEVTTYARALREVRAPQSVVAATVRALVDESLPTRLVTIRTSEDRARLLALAAAWSAEPTP
jgi:hypothetical protein